MSHAQISPERRALLLGLGVLLGAASPDAPWADEKKLSVVTEEWPPYNYLDDGVLKGFSVEVVQAILERLNLKAVSYTHLTLPTSNLV